MAKTTANSASSYLEGDIYTGAIIGRTQADGSVIYNTRYTPLFNDITVDGESVRDWMPEEVHIYPDGWGTVLVRRLNDTSGITTYHSGFPLNYTLKGQVQIV
jgi:hypothetical protein